MQLQNHAFFIYQQFLVLMVVIDVQEYGEVTSLVTSTNYLLLFILIVFHIKQKKNTSVTNKCALYPFFLFYSVLLDFYVLNFHHFFFFTEIFVFRKFSTIFNTITWS